jgi:hypothetical protein
MLVARGNLRPAFKIWRPLVRLAFMVHSFRRRLESFIVSCDTERIIQAQLASGEFHSVEEVLDKVLSLLNRNAVIRPTAKRKRRLPQQSSHR